MRFSRRGHAALLQGLAVLHELEATLAQAIGRRRMQELHATLKLVIGALDTPS